MLILTPHLYHFMYQTSTYNLFCAECDKKILKYSFDRNIYLFDYIYMIEWCLVGTWKIRKNSANEILFSNLEYFIT